MLSVKYTDHLMATARDIVCRIEHLSYAEQLAVMQIAGTLRAHNAVTGSQSPAKSSPELVSALVIPEEPAPAE